MRSDPEIDPHGVIETLSKKQRKFIRFMAGNSGRVKWSGFAEFDYCLECGLIEKRDTVCELTRGGRAVADALEEMRERKKRKTQAEHDVQKGQSNV